MCPGDAKSTETIYSFNATTTAATQKRVNTKKKSQNEAKETSETSLSRRTSIQHPKPNIQRQSWNVACEWAPSIHNGHEVRYDTKFSVMQWCSGAGGRSTLHRHAGIRDMPVEMGHSNGCGIVGVYRKLLWYIHRSHSADLSTRMERVLFICLANCVRREFIYSLQCEFVQLQRQSYGGRHTQQRNMHLMNKMTIKSAI